jgi:LysM repeat protein
MKFKSICYLVSLSTVFILSGCMARTYQLTRDRVDQDLPGNRGCVTGKCIQEEKDRIKTRTVQVVEIEFPSLFKKNKSTSEIKPQEVANEGGVTEEIPSAGVSAPEQEKLAPEVRFEKYTVLKDDTLQKISEKFYGHPGKWEKIFNANKAILKTPDKLYPGQSIDIPIESGKPAKSTSGNKKVKDKIK